MAFNKFINYFLNFLSKKWLVICLVVGIVMWVLAFGTEAYIRKNRGEAVDDHFLSELFMGIIPCILVPYGIYGIILALRLAISLEHFKNKLLSDLGNARETVTESFVVDIQLKADEKKVYQVKQAKLQLPDRFKFFIYLLVSDKGIYIHGGILRLEKIIKGLSFSQYKKDKNYTFLSFTDIGSIYIEKGGKKDWITVNLKNNKTIWLIVPADPDFQKNIFPAHLILH